MKMKMIYKCGVGVFTVEKMLDANDKFSHWNLLLDNRVVDSFNTRKEALQNIATVVATVRGSK